MTAQARFDACLYDILQNPTLVEAQHRGRTSGSGAELAVVNLPVVVAHAEAFGTRVARKNQLRSSLKNAGEDRT